MADGGSPVAGSSPVHENDSPVTEQAMPKATISQANSPKEADKSPAAETGSKPTAKSGSSKPGAADALTNAYNQVLKSAEQIPRVPKPPSSAPDFMFSRGFFLLSWQEPLHTGALFFLAMAALFGNGVMGWTWTQVALFGVVVAISAGGLLALANAAMGNKGKVSFMRISDENMVHSATASVSGGIIAVLDFVQRAADWKDAGASATALAGFWILARYAQWFNSTTITLGTFAAFIVPAALVLAWPQLDAVYSKSLAPALSGVMAQVDAVTAAVHAAASDKKQRQMVYLGGAALSLVVTYLMVTSFDLEYLFDVSSFLVLCIAALVHRMHAAKRA